MIQVTPSLIFPILHFEAYLDQHLCPLVTVKEVSFLLWKSIPSSGFQIPPLARLSGIPFLRLSSLLCITSLSLPTGSSLLPYKQTPPSTIFKKVHLPIYPLQSLLLLSTSFYSCSSVESCIDVLFLFAHFPILSSGVYPQHVTATVIALARSLVTSPFQIHWISSCSHFTRFFGSIGLVGHPLLFEGSI